jgi:hypothetical protein
MQKLVFILLFVVLLLPLQAQYKPIVFGLRVAGNVGWLKADADGYASEGAEPGFAWGFIGQFFLMENYAILTGFNVNFNGGKLEYPYLMDIDNDTVPVTGTLHRDYSLKYIQIPLCLKMQTDLSDKLRIFGKIGLGTAFLLDAKANDQFVYEGGEVDKSNVDVQNDINLMRESLIIGGGVEIILKGSTVLVLDMTYDNGFNNILSDENPATPKVKPTAYHNYVELGVGVIF